MFFEAMDLHRTFEFQTNDKLSSNLGSYE